MMDMSTGETRVMEIVSFRLNDGVDVEEFRKAAEAIDTLLQGRGTASARTLVMDDDGLWTDIIEWSTMEDAKSAAEELVKDPVFAPLGAMIDGASVQMRHAPVQHQMR
ncbi:MAG: hypothetical protein AAGK71_03175 [Pseudomonadota bacterium]